MYVCFFGVSVRTAVVAAAQDAEVDELLAGEAQPFHHLIFGLFFVYIKIEGRAW